MAKETNISMGLGIDLELLLGKIEDKKLFEGAQNRLDSLATKLSKPRKVPLDLAFETKGAEAQFKQALAQLEAEFEPALNQLGRNLKGGNIAKELSARLKEAGDSVTKDGKIVKEKLIAVLKEIANATGVKQLEGADGKHLKELFSLSGLTISEATKQLGTVSKAYDLAIKEVLKSESQLSKAAQVSYASKLKELAQVQKEIAAAKKLSDDQITRAYENADPNRPSPQRRELTAFKEAEGAPKELVQEATKSLQKRLRQDRTALEGKIKEIKENQLDTPISVKDLESRLKAVTNEIYSLGNAYKQLTGNTKAGTTELVQSTRALDSLKNSLDKLKRDRGEAKAQVARERGPDKSKEVSLSSLEKERDATQKLLEKYTSIVAAGDKRKEKGVKASEALLASLNLEIKALQDKKALQDTIDKLQDRSKAKIQTSQEKVDATKLLDPEKLAQRIAELRQAETALRSGIALGKPTEEQSHLLKTLNSEIASLEKAKQAKTDNEKAEAKQTTTLANYATEIERTTYKLSLLKKGTKEYIGLLNKLSELETNRAAAKVSFGLPEDKKALRRIETLNSQVAEQQAKLAENARINAAKESLKSAKDIRGIRGSEDIPAINAVIKAYEELIRVKKEAGKGIARDTGALDKLKDEGARLASEKAAKDAEQRAITANKDAVTKATGALERNRDVTDQSIKGSEAHKEALVREKAAVIALIDALKREGSTDSLGKLPALGERINEIRQLKKETEATLAASTKFNDLNSKVNSLSELKKVLGDHPKYLSAVNSATSGLVSGLEKLRSLKADPTMLVDIESKIKALIKEADELKLRLDLATKGKVAPTSQDIAVANQLKATEALAKAEAELTRVREHNKQFAQDAGHREKLQMLVAERRALEAYITSLSRAAAAEQKLSNPNVTKIAEFNQKITEGHEALKGLGQEINGLDNIFVQLGRSFGTFLRYAVAYRILYAIQNSIGSLTKEILNLQHALTGIKAVTLATTSQMQDVEAAIKAVAETTAFTTAEIAKGGQTLVQAGVSTSDFGKVLRATANLASATGSSFEKGAEVMTTFINVFDELDPNVIADKLTNAVNISKLNIQDLTSIANYLLSTAEGFNVSLDNTLAAATTLRNAGFKATTIATGSRQALLELLSPDDKTLKALEKRYAEIGQGMSQSAIAALFAGFKNAKNPLLAAVNEMQKLGFGTKAGESLSRVFDIRAENVIKGWVQNREELVANEIALQRTGTAAKGAQTQLESLQNSAQNLGEAIVTLVYDQTKGLVGGLKSIADAATDAVKSIKEAMDTLRAETGGSGLAQSAGVGAVTAAGLLATGKSVGRSVGFGALAGSVSALAKVFGAGEGGLTYVAKALATAMDYAAIAATAYAVQSGLGKLVGGAAPAAAAGAAGYSKAIGKGASAAKGGARGYLSTQKSLSIAADAAVVTSSVLSLGTLFAALKTHAVKLATIAFTFLRANPWVLAITALTALYNALSPGDATAEADALSNKTQALKEESLKQKEKSEAAKAAREQLQELDANYKATSARVSSLVGNSPEAQSLANKASTGAIAIGSAALNGFIESVKKLTGKDINPRDAAGTLQDLDTLTQQLEAKRALYITEVTKAISNNAEGTADKSDKALLEAFRKLTPAQQTLLSTVQTTADNGLSLLEALSKGLGVFAAAASDTQALVEAKVAELEPYARAAESEASKNSAGFLTRKSAPDLIGLSSPNKDKIELAIKEAVAAADKETTQALIDKYSRFFGPEVIQGALDAVKANSIAKLQEAAKKGLKELDEKQSAPAKTLVPISDSKALDNLVSGNKAKDQEAKAKLESDIKQKEGLLRQAYNAELAATSEEEQAKVTAERVKIANELKGLDDRLSKYTSDEVDSAVKLANLKQSFVAGEQKISALEAELKVLHGAKLKDVQRESELTKQIADVKTQQLAQEKAVLAENLKKQLAAAGIGAEGASPEEILKQLSGGAGQELFKKNKDLSDSYKALAEVVDKEALLRQKLLTDLDNSTRTELEAKKKVAEKALNKQDTKVSNLTSQLQTVTGQLTSAREKLVSEEEKLANIEQSFSDMLREVSGKPVTASDLRSQINDATTVEQAQAAASSAKGAIGSSVSKSEGEKLIKQARDVAISIQQQAVDDAAWTAQQLENSYNYLASELGFATTSQQQLKASLDALTNQIANIGTAVAAGVDEVTDTQTASTPSEGDIAALKEKGYKPYAAGGPITGPGTTTSDSITIAASAGEFMQPAKAVNMYGSDLMERIRNLNIDPNALRAAAGVKPIGGTTAEKQRQLQPVMFNIDGNMINAQASQDAVKQFQTALRLQALKNGRRV